MYNELVKRMRKCATEAGACKTCELDSNPSCTDVLMEQAADAIEELSAAVEGYESSTNMAFVEKDGETVIEFQPKWIPVTDKEHIPNTDHGVVGYFGGGAFNQLRWYDFVTTLSDGTIVGESTERDVTNEHVIAVYKLPEPPKEE